MSRIRLLIPLVLPLLLCGFARKPKLGIRFHVEATGSAGGSFTSQIKFVNPAREGHIESVPFVTEKDLSAIFPVQNPDGTNGCVFQFDKHGTFALRTVSTERRSASVVGFISTKGGAHQLVDLIIDKPITDGIIYIPRGLSPGEIAELRKLYPLMKSSGAKERPKLPVAPAP